MLAEDDVKSETKEKSFCCGCLSIGRTLRKLDQFGEIWNNILHDSVQAQMTEDILICWECRALLRKLLTFKQNVLRAQLLLFDYSIGLEDDAKSLSHLTITSLGCINVEDTDIQYEEGVITEHIKPKLEITKELSDNGQKNENKEYLNTKETQCEEANVTEDTKSELEVKEELSDNEDYQASLNDNGDEDYTESDDSANEIKIDKALKNEATQKQENAQKRHKNRYRIVTNSVKPIIVKRKIGYSELNYWLEVDKNSEYYKNGKFRCDKCLIVYKSGVAVKKHNELIHARKGRRNLCDICLTYIARKNELINHINGHYYIRNCTMCGYTCNGVKNMEAHVKAHKKYVQCLECEHWLSDVQGFKKHYELAHKIFVCDYCNKECRIKRALEQHIFREHRVHRCEACNKVYKNYKLYCYHIQYMHKLLPTEAAFCVVCNKQFRNEILFKMHLAATNAHAFERNGDQNPNKIFQCSDCEKQFKSAVTMRNHYNLVHLNKSRHYCSLCDKKFLNSGKYRLHHKIKHEGYVEPKNKICNVCGRGFKLKQVLINHMRTHTGERPFACTECDARFAQKVALTSHIKFIHLKNRRKLPTTTTNNTMSNFNT